MQFTVAKHTRVMKEIAKSNSRYLKEVYGFMWVSSAVLGSGSCRMDTSVRRMISDQLSAVSHVIKTSGDCGIAFSYRPLSFPTSQYSQSIFLKITVKQDGLAWSPSIHILQRTKAALCVGFVFSQPD